MPSVSVVIPAYNEADSIRGVIERVRTTMAEAGIVCEVLVVVDGATDATAEEAAQVADRVIEHPLNLGYGRSLKSGIQAATHDLIAITDADGTYPVERLPELIKLTDRHHMVVGARTGSFYAGSPAKQIGRSIFRFLCEFAVGQSIPDINSGMRVFRKSEIVPFFPTVSGGFSFTTTATLLYLLNDRFVLHVPIDYFQRTGTSKVRHVRDSLRALQIIVEAILRYNPIKIFLLLAAPQAILGLPLAGFGFLLAFAARTFTSWYHLTGMLGLAMFVVGAAAILSSLLTMALGSVAVATMPQRRFAESGGLAIDLERRRPGFVPETT
ncbi:MAG TPA: glycosyltransferase family 2 protein [Pirellulaceae bacterium]|jgi:glycosyltransferase involved in cell wall biosynthesis|nr:glycosyltransferase family 2 protein [Pirellulaceae bacterium]